MAKRVSRLCRGLFNWSAEGPERCRKTSILLRVSLHTLSNCPHGVLDRSASSELELLQINEPSLVNCLHVRFIGPDPSVSPSMGLPE